MTSHQLNAASRLLGRATLPVLLMAAAATQPLQAQAQEGAAGTTLTVRASGTLAVNVGPRMEVRVNGESVGVVEVRSQTLASYRFPVTSLPAGAEVDIVFTNDGSTSTEDRNLYVASIDDGMTTVQASAPIVRYDKGKGLLAFDGVDVVAGRENMAWNGALRLSWPSAEAKSVAAQSASYDAARFLSQATFGPTAAEIKRLSGMSYSAWLDEQMRMPSSPEFVKGIQAKFAKGEQYLPGGKKFSHEWNEYTFWRTAAKSPDQLRRRVAYSLHQIFVTSLMDSGGLAHPRAFANYCDMLNRLAFGNFRTMIEEIALSPAMGYYLSHIRNLKEDPALGRLPDENFARELMQLFTIGLHELNVDGSRKLYGGKPIETYNNDDVMALAKVFTGWSWGFDDSQLTLANFKYGIPNYAAGDTSDLQRMKPYPGMTSTAAKTLFAGKPNAVTIPEGAGAAEGLKMALDALFMHPNVGPFIGRQLIQKLVTSNPSPAYVARVAKVFNNNGKGVRGDMAAVVRAILLDAEARQLPTADGGKLREPVLRMTNWIRAFNANSVSGEYTITNELQRLGQRPLYSPSVFSFYRPGYVPPTGAFARDGLTSPELQIVNETTVAAWINQVEQLMSVGAGWYGNGRDVTTGYQAELKLAAADPTQLVEHVSLLLYGGRMSGNLRNTILEAVQGVSASSSNKNLDRARLAVFLAMVSPEYLVQK